MTNKIVIKDPSSGEMVERDISGLTPAELEAFQIAAGIADRGDFCVRSRIEQSRHLVPAAADNLAVANHDGAERAAAVFAHAGACESDRFIHPARVLRGVIGGIRHRRIRELY